MCGGACSPGRPPHVLAGVVIMWALECGWFLMGRGERSRKSPSLSLSVVMWEVGPPHRPGGCRAVSGRCYGLRRALKQGWFVFSPVRCPAPGRTSLKPCSSRLSFVLPSRVSVVPACDSVTLVWLP